ncbi:MAG: CDP-diacylglycerol--glycerol-3-phosphate 3-phosphatidyltransferase [Xanthomonadales bacterium]|nr:CDP-diacylglycerol--glycerol-3-phosphate 3-phosphatidyltransferase [Xanthomonadales bacterium]
MAAGVPLTIPTILTLGRIVSIPILIVVFYLPYQWTHLAAAAVFALGALTDWLDGWIARRYGMYSKFGAFLDPVADKLAVAVALILILQRHPSMWFALVAAVIIGREITISALREWMAEIGQRARVNVAGVGKVKTIVQMLALVMLLYEDPLFDLPVFLIGAMLLAVAAALTLWSGYLYLRASWPSMAEHAGETTEPPPQD